MTLLNRLNAPGAKRILALDGGGIRGALTLGFLARIEEILRARHQAPKLVLADYFDLIGGTSTGAIIAAALAKGMSAAEIERIYLDFGGEVFGAKQGLGLLRGKFAPEPLKAKLREYFGEIRLDGNELRTGLCIVAKRSDTNSTWPLHNHPEGRYYRHTADMLLYDAVRASTAAPTYFDPEMLTFDTSSGRQSGEFVDGGVSMHNNPALQLFLLATLEGFPFHWQTGEDQLLIVSVGTGFWSVKRKSGSWLRDRTAFRWAADVPSMLMDDANWQNQLLLQYFSKSPTAYPIDREIGDLRNDVLGGRALLSYLRYNVELAAEPLTMLGLTDLAKRATLLHDMSNAENRHDLAAVGKAAAQRQVLPQHLPRSFDLAPS